MSRNVAAWNFHCCVSRWLAEPESQGRRSLQSLTISITIVLTCISCAQSVDPPSQHEPQSVASDKNPPAESAAAESEKTYDGRTLTEWRREIKNLDPADPAAAKAVPGLMEIVADRDAPWFSRRQAAQTLGRIGPAASEAIPLFIQLLDEAGDGESNPSLWAAKALALFGADAKSAAPVLIERLKDKSLSQADRQVSLDPLSRIGTADPTVLPALIDIVSSAEEDDTLRMLTAESLAFLGSHAAAAVPALLRVTSSKNESLRRSAVMAIGAIGPMADVALPTLAELLVFDESAAVRDRAADALSQIGTPAVELLTRLTVDEDPEVRWRVARSLGQIRPPAESAVPTMTKLLKDDDDNVRMHALESLWAIQPQAERLIPPVLQEFTNPDRQIRIRAYKLLISMGASAKPAIDQLKMLAEDERPFVQQAAMKALDALMKEKTRR